MDTVTLIQAMPTELANGMNNRTRIGSIGGAMPLRRRKKPKKKSINAFRACSNCTAINISNCEFEINAHSYQKPNATCTDILGRSKNNLHFVAGQGSGDVLLELLDGAGAVLASANPLDRLAATVAADLPAAGTYYLRVSGVGAESPTATGYSRSSRSIVCIACIYMYSYVYVSIVCIDIY